MGYYEKLYVFDITSEADVDQANGRFDDDGTVYQWGIVSKEHLIQRLDNAKRAGHRFNKVLFQTHGSEGAIKFNGRSIWDTTIRDDFEPRGYHALFPMYTRFYFDGCNVGAGTLGDGFIEKVGSTFLKLGGGEVMAWTSAGYGMSGWLPFVGGHTVHFTGDVKRMFFTPGGIKVQETAPESPWGKDRPGQRDNIGHNI
jgi:hypothetical protein